MCVDTRRICSSPACQRGPSRTRQDQVQDGTSHFNQTSKEDIAHSAIIDWVQAMTSVETANVGKNFHHRRAPGPMAGSMCDEKKFATYQVSMSRGKTDCRLTCSVSLSPIFWFKSSIKLLELKLLCEGEKLRKEKISGRAVGFYRADRHTAAPETTRKLLDWYIHSSRKFSCSKRYHEENHLRNLSVL